MMCGSSKSVSLTYCWLSGCLFCFRSLLLKSKKQKPHSKPNKE